MAKGVAFVADVEFHSMICGLVADHLLEGPAISPRETDELAAALVNLRQIAMLRRNGAIDGVEARDKGRSVWTGFERTVSVLRQETLSRPR